MSTSAKYRCLWIAGLTLAFLLPSGAVQANPSALEEIQNAFIEVSRNVQPSVVNISPVQKIKPMGNAPHQNPYHGRPFQNFFGENPFEEFFRHLPQREFKQKGLGSGLIVDKKGYILTNNHVIEKADEITVILSDNTKFSGKVLGTDPKTDIAVVKIEPGDYPLKAVRLGDSDKCRIGQWAIAIGNPFGLNHTVTVGVISATGRTDMGITTYENFLQTDAAINFGNSGGPLVNLAGEVVGINTAILAAGQGIGFAVPINMAKQVMEQLIKHGRVVRGWMGIAIQQISEELGRQFGVKEGEGVLVGQVFKGDPAEKAGIKVGDVIIEFEGTPITSPAQLSRLAATAPPHKAVKLVVIRNKKRQTIEITLGEQKDTTLEAKKDSGSAYGMEVSDLTPRLLEEYNLSRQEGVVVTQSSPGGAADKAGLRPGDVIVEINRRKISNLSDYEKLLAELKEEANLVVLRIRNQNSHYVVLEGK